MADKFALETIRSIVYRRHMDGVFSVAPVDVK